MKQNAFIISAPYVVVSASGGFPNSPPDAGHLVTPGAPSPSLRPTVTPPGASASLGRRRVTPHGVHIDGRSRAPFVSHSLASTPNRASYMLKKSYFGGVLTPVAVPL